MSFFCAIVADHCSVVTIAQDLRSIYDKNTLSEGYKCRMVEDLSRVIESLHAELMALSDRRVVILRKIAVVRQTIEGLAELFGPGVIDDELRQLLWPRRCVSRRVLGSLCRRLLGSQQRSMQVCELLNLIENEYPRTFEYVKNPDIYLRSVLEFLVTEGELVEERTESDLVAWKIGSPGVECSTVDDSSVRTKL